MVLILACVVASVISGMIGVEIGRQFSAPKRKNVELPDDKVIVSWSNDSAITVLEMDDLMEIIACLEQMNIADVDFDAFSARWKILNEMTEAFSVERRVIQRHRLIKSLKKMRG